MKMTKPITTSETLCLSKNFGRCLPVILSEYFTAMFPTLWFSDNSLKKIWRICIIYTKEADISAMDEVGVEKNTKQ